MNLSLFAHLASRAYTRLLQIRGRWGGGGGGRRRDSTSKNKRGSWPGCSYWGYSHIKTYRVVPQKWVGSLQEIPRHGSHFSLKNPQQRVCFTNFLGLHSKPWKLWKMCFCNKIPRNGYLFLEKSLEMGTYFRKNNP